MENNFKTIKEKDKERGHKATGGSVFGNCICGNRTDFLRFFGDTASKVYCCNDSCYDKINVAYFSKHD